MLSDLCPEYLSLFSGTDWIKKPWDDPVLPVGTTISLGGDEDPWIVVESHMVWLDQEELAIQCKFNEISHSRLEESEAARTQLWEQLTQSGWVPD
jgi:hypothetical protein